MRYKRVLWLLTGVAVLLAVGAARLAYDRAVQAQFTELNDRGASTLTLAASSLSGLLSRFERLPALLAEQPPLRALLRYPDDPAHVAAANRHLRENAERSGASVIYVMNRDGVTLASSNYDQPTSFVGGDFSFRPYFTQAMAGGLGRFYALGTTSNKRGYYFGAPVEIGRDRLGVVVIKIDLDQIERAWAYDDLRIIVTDTEGIVFLSYRPDWLFHTFGALDPELLARTRETRRYANADIGEIDHMTGTAPGGHAVLRTVAHDGGREEFLALQTDMPRAGWTMQVLLPTASAYAQALTLVSSGAFALGVLGLGGFSLWQRRRQLAERLAVQSRAATELEARVAQRTSELKRANTALQDEVAERRTAEDRLRQTQAELVQAGKLAALGQMSAALSHEFNQPLAAARNYAENATAYLDRDRVPEARDTIGQILGMIDRMTRISRHLRNFARKPNEQLRAVSLGEAVVGARDVLAWRLDKAGVSLDVQLGDPAPVVTGGLVRLQQVLVNLLSNAIDVVETTEDRRLHLHATPRGEMVEITLRDHGPGVPDALQARIFDPFFSTKEVGKGLGLGLSITYNIVRDFGGSLRVANAPDGGAVFTLTLRAAHQPALDAAE
ncbi:MAG: GHKL domain-containing protein [Alphaproteobacteria bacterium]|nr:GHKL domain-containing protein [Alphaproteobacteria bacterium]